ncbi:MAG: glycosyltransferase family 9 protein [Bacteroidales bacterium]|nr:glycosyltransferase family 9 protein [Bacteroidales bacterium]
MVKFLVVRFSSIGDIVLTTPVIRCLKQQVDEAEVHFLTKEKFKDVVHGNPYIDKFHYLDKENYVSLIQTLKSEKFDYIIDLHKNLRTKRLQTKLKRMAFTFDKLNAKKWLTVRFKMNCLPDIHIVDRYFKAVKPFSVENDGKGLDFFIDDTAVTNAQKELNALGNYVVIVLGANHTTKQIPIEKIEELCQKIKSKIVLIGGKKEMPIADQITKSNHEILNKTGQFSIHESALAIKMAKVVITPDTGMMHIAAAFQKNILSIWGNTVPKFGMFPYNPGTESKIFEINGLKCRPCSKIGYDKCPKKHFDCMNKQDTNTIVSYCNTLVSL